MYRIFRAVKKNGTVSRESLSATAVLENRVALRAEYRHLKTPPHDLRRTCAMLCRQAGGDLEQTQFWLGHASIQTTAAAGDLLLGGLLASQFSLKSMFPVSHVIPVTIGIDERVPATWFDARVLGFHSVITPVCAKKNVAVK